MFRAPKRPRNQLHQTRLERRTHQLAAQLRQSESGDPRYPPAEHRQHRSASTLRKTKFVVLAMAALASAAAELPPPMFEHLAIPTPAAAVVSPRFPFLVLVLAPVINRRATSFGEIRLTA